MLRLTTILECLQGSQRSNACLLKEQEAKTTLGILTRRGIDHVLSEIEDQYLYTISISIRLTKEAEITIKIKNILDIPQNS